MDQASTLLKDITNNSAILYQIIQKIKKNSEFYDDSYKKWEKACLEIPGQISCDSIKIAVTGAIKSGKSTFVNSIFKTDFLKRGAGVLTSVVTKIQRQERLRAKISIKSWDEVNLEIEQALLFFDDHYLSENKHFDLRRDKDRKYLEKTYKKLLNKKSITDNQVRSEMILLNNVLKNYKFCKDIIEPDETMLEFENDKFKEHKVFTGDPTKAFFIKDVILEVNFSDFDKDIEIADCQGIDSTDIGQLSKVLEYLESSNMIIYLISSRTGLREADIRFLSIINKMGISDNVIFVINCDLSEHESLNDLIDMKNGLEHDLRFFKQNLNLYTFSSLYNLFNQIKSEISAKDKKRIQIWGIDKEIIQYSDNMTEKFFDDFTNLINKDRTRLILTNPEQRLTAIAKSLQKKVHFLTDILLDDEIAADKTIERLKEIQLGVAKIKALVEKSMHSLGQDLKKEIYKQIDVFFKVDNDSIIDDIIFFINDYTIDLKKLEERLIASGFPKALFPLFQNFKKEFDFFLVEKIKPDIGRFIKNNEKILENSAIELYDLYKVDLFDLHEKLGEMPKELFEYRADILNLPDLKALKKEIGIRPPEAVFIYRYNARIKISTFTGLGLYSLFLLFFKKVKKELKTVRASILRNTSLRFKNEALRSIKLQLEKYRQRLKNEYFNILINALSEEINTILIDQFQVYSIEIDNIESIIKKDKSEKNKHKEFLKLISKDIKMIL